MQALRPVLHLCVHIFRVGNGAQFYAAAQTLVTSLPSECDEGLGSPAAPSGTEVELVIGIVFPVGGKPWTVGCSRWKRKKITTAPTTKTQEFMLLVPPPEEEEELEEEAGDDDACGLGARMAIALLVRGSLEGVLLLLL